MTPKPGDIIRSKTTLPSGSVTAGKEYVVKEYYPAWNAVVLVANDNGLAWMASCYCFEPVAPQGIQFGATITLADARKYLETRRGTVLGAAGAIRIPIPEEPCICFGPPSRNCRAKH